METRNFLNKRAYGPATVGVEAIELVTVLCIILAGALVMPILLFGKTGWLAENSNLIIGPAVNCALIIAGINFRGWIKTAGVILMPSVLAITVGLLAFSSVFAMYMIPAIWLGNMAIVLLFKYLHTHKKINYIMTAFIAIAIKAGIIFAGYNLLVQYSFIPAGPAAKMYLAMGFHQLITATVGAVLAFGIVKTLYPKQKSMI